MEENMSSLKKNAKVAGLLFLILIIASLYAHVYVPLQIFIRGDAVATTNNVLANEFLFRTCIAVGILEATVFLFLAFTLYRLLKGVSNHLARLMVALAVVQVPVAFVLATLKLTSLMILKSEMSNSISAGQLPEVSMFFLEINGYGMMALALFSGLWLLPFGLLVYKSRFIPRVFGVLLMIAGAGQILDGFISMLFPDFGQPKALAYIFFGLGEISIMLWLLIQGVKDHLSIEVLSETTTVTRSSSVKLNPTT